MCVCTCVQKIKEREKEEILTPERTDDPVGPSEKAPRVINLSLPFVNNFEAKKRKKEEEEVGINNISIG